MNPLDIPGQAFELELLNPNPSSRRTKDGPIYRITFEVSKEVHASFMEAREGNLRLIGYLSVLPDANEEVQMPKPKKEKPAKGEYGQFWRALWQAGFWACPGVAEKIEDQIAPNEIFKSNDERYKIGLRRVFNVESLTFVSPAQVTQKFDIPQVYTIVDQAIRKTANESPDRTA